MSTIDIRHRSGKVRQPETDVITTEPRHQPLVPPLRLRERGHIYYGQGTSLHSIHRYRMSCGRWRHPECCATEIACLTSLAPAGQLTVSVSLHYAVQQMLDLSRSAVR